MSQWGSSDSGILRKNKADDNLDQLLVFGYSCKVFRDDEKAQYIDQGKHLIPWMGDQTLKIDRYDGRAALSDVRNFEASREGYDTLRWLGLSESEKKLEELCDSERYYSLGINEEEEEMYKEEVAKRQKTNAIAFDYNNPQPQLAPPEEGIPTVPEKEEEDEPYKPSPVLDVPVDINIPKTVKEYARIEKTALFVCRQGPQMEILIKAKQADNPQFSFLIVQDPLYRFYRHVLSAFKNGRYQPQCDTKKQDEATPSDATSRDDQDSHYLHPSLQSTSGKLGARRPEDQHSSYGAQPLSSNPSPSASSRTNQQQLSMATPPPLPTVPYRPSADCAYSQLVNRIQGTTTGLGANGQSDAHAPPQQQQPPNQMEIINQMNLEQQYHQYYYVQQFYEYWRHTVINSEQGAMYAGLPLDFSQLDPNMQSYIHQLAWAQFVQHHQAQLQEAQQQQAQANNNSYAQIVSNLNKDVVNPYTANVPQLPPTGGVAKEEEAKVVEDKPHEERTVTLVKYETNEVIKQPLLSLAAAYGSGSDSDSDSSDSEEEVHVIKVPTGETQTVIDKMAEYVAKNGEQFEVIIRQKGDARFGFLNDGHEFNKYYRAKLRELRGDPEPELRTVKKVEQKPAKQRTRKVIAPVSFSIKKPKEEPPKEIKSALPMEDSSDEETSQATNPKTPPPLAESNPKPSDNALAQKMPNNPKTVYKIGTAQSVPSVLQAKVGQPSRDNDGVEKAKSESPMVEKLATKRSPRSRTRTPSPPRKRPKSPRPPEEAQQKVRVKRRRSPVLDMFATEEDAADVANGTVATPTATGTTKNGVGDKDDDPILEMMELEKEGKSADDKSDARERARQLERKRKAAAFLKLKLKSAEDKPTPAPAAPPAGDDKSKTSPSESSGESVVSVRSRSTTREKSVAKGRGDRRRDGKRHKKTRYRSRSGSDDRRKRRDKKKKSHKRKHSKSKKKSKKHKRSRSPSSDSVKSHISIDSS